MLLVDAVFLIHLTIMALHKRENSSNWYYQFQFKNKKFVGSTGTSNKSKALQVEREVRNKVHSQAYFGES